MMIHVFTLFLDSLSAAHTNWKSKKLSVNVVYGHSDATGTAVSMQSWKGYFQIVVG